MTLETTPLQADRQYLPVQTLRVDVEEGLDKGQSHVALADAFSIGTSEGNDLVLSDPTVSRYHVDLTRGAQGIVVIDRGSTNGTFAGSTRIERGLVAPGTRLRLGRSLLRVTDAEATTVDLHAGEVLADLHGRSAVMRRLMAQIERCAQTDVSVLIAGESGTGKELIARALHSVGPRAAGPFVVVDCGALAPHLVASELFGHERGAFTGAEQRHPGAFERAHGGTLFLDEVGELPAELQSVLLGALERRRFRRVGGRQEIEVDVHVVSATNRDLRAEVNANTFRLDLYYRLAVVGLSVPPLRERPEDLGLLIAHFLREAGYDGDANALFSPTKMQELSRYRWPGNVRELRNVVEATLAIGEAPLPGAVAQETASGSAGGDVEHLLHLPYKQARQEILADFELRYVHNLLDSTGGNVSEAARVARMDRSYLSGLVKRLGLK